APELPDPLPPGVLLPLPHADQSGNASKAQLTSRRENIFIAAVPSIANALRTRRFRLIHYHTGMGAAPPVGCDQSTPRVATLPDQELTKS
ncbi:MAG: hypothetical protein M3O50_10810, partial [Myxococcota bacterium]|nr:hypothetical protein [Myxococcota bacterium]